MKRITWMPHAGHFCGGNECQFRLNSYINGYIISTVGELKWSSTPESSPFVSIGVNRLYETMVFKGKKSKHKCCPYTMSGSELDMLGYNTADDARHGHMKLLRKWSRK